MSIAFRTANGAETSYSTIDEIGAALLRQERPVHADGSLFTITEFLGGLLFDGYPLNVLLDGVWYPGQMEALEGAGWQIPSQARTLPTVNPAAAAAIDWQQWIMYGSIGYALYKMLFKK